jgi:small subunit ribosomal protein S10
MAAKVKQKIRIKLKAYDSRILDKAAKRIIEIGERSGAIAHGPVPLPIECKKISVTKSPHVHKDAFEQFEMRIHKRLIDISNVNSKTIDDLTNLDMPAGVDIEIKQ